MNITGIRLKMKLKVVQNVRPIEDDRKVPTARYVRST
jgi:hypothetical protein